MGVFPLIALDPPLQFDMINITSTTSESPFKGKSIPDVTYLSPSEVVYHAIQSTSNDCTTSDRLLVASDPYSFPY